MKQEKTLTEGSLFKGIFCFSVPLIFTNLLQVLFNMADLAVVGKFAGDNALGAVGSTPMLTFFCTGILMGIGLSVNSITAYYIGAKKSDQIRNTVRTSAVVCAGSGIFLTVFCILLSRPVLTLMNTKPELMEDALLYFRIYCMSLPFLGIYNFGNGILSAEGDTKSPLIYLLVSGMVNVVLNVLFVIGFGMSVSGVALASVISIALSAFLVGFRLMRRNDDLALRLRELTPDREIFVKLMKIGLPAGLQNGIFAFANMFIQSGVNSFDSAMVVANSAAANADPFVYQMMGAFYTACATFIGQNYGAGNKKRIMQSYFISLGYAVLAGVMGGIIFIRFGKAFMGLFTSSHEVIELGYQRLLVLACSFWIAPFMDNTLAASRGLGKTFVPTIMVVAGSCVFRIIWIYTVFAGFRTIFSLFALFPVSWIITAIAQIVYFIRLYRKTGGA